MARENFVLKTLLEKREVTFKPHGNSMTPKIHSGDQVTVRACGPWAYRVGDVVYAKVKGNYYLQLLTALDESAGSGYLMRFQISNNHGHVNGWCSARQMYGICVKVKDKVLVSDKELKERSKEGFLKVSQSDKDLPSVLAVPMPEEFWEALEKNGFSKKDEPDEE